VIQKHGETVTYDGALEGMKGDTEYEIVSAVTAVDHPTNGVQLLGIGYGSYVNDRTQHESMLNPHFLALFSDIDEMPKRRGGKQKLTTPSGDIDIYLRDNRVTYINTRLPTQEEMRDISIHWLVPQGSKEALKRTVEHLKTTTE
jgi:hypothetical protein